MDKDKQLSSAAGVCSGSCQHLAAVTGPTKQVTAGPGLQLLVAGLCGDQQLEEEDLIRTAAAFILVCRRESREEVGRLFRQDTRKNMV